VNRSKDSPAQSDTAMPRTQRLVREARARLAKWRGLQDLLTASAAWRTLGPMLRGWMSPATLGSGRTILEDLEEAQAGVDASLTLLEADLVPAEVLWEMSELALAQEPAVSVLVTNRDGAEALQSFLGSYAAHHGPAVAELVILDHASDDDSVEVVRAWMDRLPIQLLRCNRNQRFGVANNLARRYARGRILVFANNDLRFDEPVISALVEALRDETVGLAGAELWYPDAQGRRSDRCQHRGIRFRADASAGFQRPFNVQEGVPSGASALAETAEIEAEGDSGIPGPVPAVTAALAACRTEDFDAIGGFVADYDYGFEDVDLALTLLRQLGKGSVVCGVGAVHQEFGTQHREPEARLAERRADNARLLRSRHGAWLARQVVRSQLSGAVSGEPASSPAPTGHGEPATWHEAPIPVRLPPGQRPSESPPAGLAPLAAGSRVDPEGFPGLWLVDDPAELASPPPRGALSLARVRPDTADDWLATPGFRHADVVLCDEADDVGRLARQSRALVLPTPGLGGPGFEALSWLPGVIEAWINRPGLALKTATPDEAERQSWGDFHFAEALGRALRDLGYRVRNDILPDWHRPAFMPDDLSLVLRGLEGSTERFDGVNLLWLISHPTRVSDAELERHDHVFVASDPYAQLLASRLQTPVSALLQCTEPERFPFVDRPGAPDRRVFVGNSKGYFRPIVKAALEAGEPVEIWGTWWHEHIDESLIRGEAVPNEELGALYGNSGVVLNDHWPDMARLGFLSNRLFDVASTGSLIVSDPVRGLGAVFGDQVVVADQLPEGFPSLDAGIVADREGRRALAETISRHHTFEQRARTIARVVRDLAPGGFTVPSEIP
jgi:GT2 family glycosyltransferase